MRKCDTILRNWRVSKALPHVQPGDRLLDIGCLDGYLIERVRGRVSYAIGVDPLAQPCRTDHVRIVRDFFPMRERVSDGECDCITMLAVFEHLPDLPAVIAECYRVLKPGGRVVLTVPSPRVDAILWILERLRLADGMSTDEHHGFDVAQTAELFGRAGFVLARRDRFQLGLNNLFVFIKPEEPAVEAGRSEPSNTSQVPSEPAELVTVN